MFTVISYPLKTADFMTATPYQNVTYSSDQDPTAAPESHSMLPHNVP